MESDTRQHARRLALGRERAQQARSRRTEEQRQQTRQLDSSRRRLAERVANETHLERSDFHFLLSIYMPHVSPTACTGRPGLPT